MSCSNTNCGCGCTPNICSQTTTCTTFQCACPVMIASDCVNNVTEDLACSSILKGQTLTEVLKQLDAYICTKFSSLTEFLTIINVGEGAEVFKGANLLGKKQLRSLVDSNLINIVEGTDEITISVDETALNTYIEANQLTYTLSNAGETGASIYTGDTVVGNNTQFNLRRLKSSDSSVTITEDGGEINFTVDTPSTVSSGLYTPTVLNSVNTSGLTSSLVSSWTQVGEIVTVTTSVALTVTTANTLSSFTVSLPVNRNSGNLIAYIGLGSLFNPTLTSTSTNAFVNSSSTSTATVFFYPTSNASPFNCLVTFQYSVLS